MSESARAALKLLTKGMAGYWSDDGLTTFLYGISRLQRTWFVLLYELRTKRTRYVGRKDLRGQKG